MASFPSAPLEGGGRGDAPDSESDGPTVVKKKLNRLIDIDIHFK